MSWGLLLMVFLQTTVRAEMNLSRKLSFECLGSFSKLSGSFIAGMCHGGEICFPPLMKPYIYLP